VSEVICRGCGAAAPETVGPTHAYIDASPACWQMYTGELVWAYSLVGDEGITTAQHLVDAYAAQHATNTDRRNRQSVAAHLMSLCAALEFDMSGRARRSALGHWAHHDFPILRPCPDQFPITIRNIKDERVDARSDIVNEMARSTWSAWSVHHDHIRTLLLSSLT
jgi:hypothetical protein